MSERKNRRKISGRLEIADLFVCMSTGGTEGRIKSDSSGVVIDADGGRVVPRETRLSS